MGNENRRGTRKKSAPAKPPGPVFLHSRGHFSAAQEQYLAPTIGILQALQSSSLFWVPGGCFQLSPERKRIRYLLSSKELHPQQSKHHDEEEQQEEQTDDGLHGVQQGDHQIPQGIPVPVVQMRAAR